MIWTLFANGYTGAAELRSVASAVVCGWGVGECQHNRVLTARIVRVTVGPRAINDLRCRNHPVVKLNWIPGGRIGMSDRYEGVQAIEHFFCVTRVDEWISVFSNGMPEVRGGSEEEAARIDGGSRDGYKLSARACLVT